MEYPVYVTGGARPMPVAADSQEEAEDKARRDGHMPFAPAEVCPGCGAGKRYTSQWCLCPGNRFADRVPGLRRKPSAAP